MAFSSDEVYIRVYCSRPALFLVESHSNSHLVARVNQGFLQCNSAPHMFLNRTRRCGEVWGSMGKYGEVGLSEAAILISLVLRHQSFTHMDGIDCKKIEKSFEWGWVSHQILAEAESCRRV